MSKILKIIGGGYRHNDEITFLKGFSILTIVLMHYLQSESLSGIVHKALSIGGTGVHAFFFCSGFGLYLSYLKKPISYMEFVRKRFLKIYMPYIIVVGVSALLPYMYDGNRLNAFLSHAFLYKMFSPIYEESIGPFWFISTLFQFYLFFIPLVKLKEKVNKIKLFGFGCFWISVFWWIISAETGIAEQRIWGSFFLQYLWEFALGMLIAEYCRDGKEIQINKGILIIVAVCGIGIAGVAKLIGGFLTVFNDVFALFGYGAFALFIYSTEMKMVNRFVRFISGISYEIFLVHILVFNTVHYFLPSRFVTVLVSLPVSIGLALLFNKIMNLALLNTK